MGLVIERFVYPLFQENTYLVGDEEARKAFIIDPGGPIQRVAEAVERHRWIPEAIILTHGHIDHLYGAAEAHRRFGVPVWIHAADEVWLHHLVTQSQMLGVPLAEEPPVGRSLADGDLLGLGASQARVIHTPGHSAGGICLHFAGARTLFTGDTLFAGSVGRTDLPEGDPAALLASIQERILPLGDEVVFYPGHGPDGTLGHERCSNPYLSSSARI